MNIIGVDPGRSGAIAILDIGGNLLSITPFKNLTEIIDLEDDPIAKENLMALINDCLEDLWLRGKDREREYKKYLILVQTITKNDQLISMSREILVKFGYLFQILKKPKITKEDIREGKKIIKNLGFDLYAPFHSNPKFKLKIEKIKE